MVFWFCFLFLNTATVDFDHHIKSVLRLYKKKKRRKEREGGRKEGKEKERKRGRKAIDSPRYNRKELSEQDIPEPGFLSRTLQTRGNFVENL